MSLQEKGGSLLKLIVILAVVGAGGYWLYFNQQYIEEAAIAVGIAAGAFIIWWVFTRTLKWFFILAAIAIAIMLALTYFGISVAA